MQVSCEFGRSASITEAFNSVKNKDVSSGGRMRGAGYLRKCPQSKIPGVKKVVLPFGQEGHCALFDSRNF